MIEKKRVLSYIFPSTRQILGGSLFLTIGRSVLSHDEVNRAYNVDVMQEGKRWVCCFAGYKETQPNGTYFFTVPSFYPISNFCWLSMLLADLL